MKPKFMKTLYTSNTFMCTTAASVTITAATTTCTARPTSATITTTTTTHRWTQRQTARLHQVPRNASRGKSDVKD